MGQARTIDALLALIVIMLGLSMVFRAYDLCFSCSARFFRGH